MKKNKTLKMAQMAILAAILIVMALTPLGYLRLTPALEITFLVLPVALGAIVMGPVSGMVLGGIFGLTSFYQCVSGMSAFGAALLGINPLLTFLVCLLPRLLLGLFAGLVFRGCAKRGGACKTAGYFLACLTGSVTNTVLFIGMVWLFFGRTDFIVGLTGSGSIIAAFTALAGVNALLEIPVNTLIGGAVTKGVDLVLKKAEKQR